MYLDWIIWIAFFYTVTNELLFLSSLGESHYGSHHKKKQYKRHMFNTKQIKLDDLKPQMMSVFSV